MKDIPTFDEIIQQAYSDIESSKSYDDTSLIDDTQKEGSQYGKHYDERDKSYSRLLDEYINVYSTKANANSTYKKVFFYTAISVFCSIIGISLVALIVIAFKKTFNPSDIGVLISGLTGIISSIIVLPKIIAEYLFPTNEDRNMNEMIKSMQENDAQIRNNFQKKKDEKPTKRIDLIPH